MNNFDARLMSKETRDVMSNQMTDKNQIEVDKHGKMIVLKSIDLRIDGIGRNPKLGLELENIRIFSLKDN